MDSQLPATCRARSMKSVPRLNARYFDPFRAGVSQTVVAAGMGTAASVVSKLELGADVKLSALRRHCDAIGQTFPPHLGKKAA